jgi:hypothetical protein
MNKIGHHLVLHTGLTKKIMQHLVLHTGGMLEWYQVAPRSVLGVCHSHRLAENIVCVGVLGRISCRLAKSTTSSTAVAALQMTSGMHAVNGPRNIELILEVFA